MRVVLLFSLLALAACASPMERGIAAHTRHERNSILAETAERAANPQAAAAPEEKPK